MYLLKSVNFLEIYVKSWWREFDDWWDNTVWLLEPCIPPDVDAFVATVYISSRWHQGPNMGRYVHKTNKETWKKKFSRQQQLLETKHGQMLLKRVNRLITSINYVKYNLYSIKFNICNGKVKKKLLLVKIFVFVRNIN